MISNSYESTYQVILNYEHVLFMTGSIDAAIEFYEKRAALGGTQAVTLQETRCLRIHKPETTAKRIRREQKEKLFS